MKSLQDIVASNATARRASSTSAETLARATSARGRLDTAYTRMLQLTALLISTSRPLPELRLNLERAAHELGIAVSEMSAVLGELLDD